MMYSPHILQVKSIVGGGEDDYGRPLPSKDVWADVCSCRCDDNTTKEFRSANGEVYRPSYHIVCEGNVTVQAGDEIRCMNAETIRGSGKVYLVKRLNVLNYSEIWV